MIISAAAFATGLYALAYRRSGTASDAKQLGPGAIELSWLLAASGAGALVGALLTAAAGGWKRRGALLVGAAFAHGTLLIFFGLQHTVVGAMVFVGLTSLAVMIFMGMANTLMQTRTPDALRGRVMSVQTMVFIGFMPLGQLILGSIGTLIGIFVSVAWIVRRR